MITAAILAGGTGSRMGSVKKPKQYLMLGTKPVFIHTLEKFMSHPQFEQIVVLCPEQWLHHTKKLMEKYMEPGLLERGVPKVSVISGGATRNETILKAIQYLEEETHVPADEIFLVTHDSVRPFVTYRIIEENIHYGMEYGACDTVMPASDTIVESLNGSFLSKIPDRQNLYQGQTPQSFWAGKWKNLYGELPNEDKNKLSDALRVYTMMGEQVWMVRGEAGNIKITYSFDYQIAEQMVRDQYV